LPYRLALGLGWVLAWLAFYVFRWRVRTAISRIEDVFGDQLTRREVRRVAWVSLRNTFFNGVEVMRIPSITKAWVEDVLDTSVINEFKLIWGGEEGAIFALPHMGNWDVAGVAATLFDLPIFTITGKQHNPLFDDYMNHMRGFTGIETIPRDSKTLLRKVIRNLKAGKILAFTSDLRSRTKGMSVQFLGKEANIVAGMALFARQTNVPVFPVVVTREGWGRHKWHVCEPIRPDKSLDKQDDWNRITQYVMDKFEVAIRERPDQYFWYNKRWVLDPFVEKES
jgi:lauroyl/myristoyl acyltransferase